MRTLRRLMFPCLSPKRQACIYVGMANLTEFNLAESHRSSQPHSRNPGCAVARAARRLGARQRRERYLERIRYRGPPDRRGAHRLDAAGADHTGERRSAAI